jgi:two-component system chemotaxis response regulator CheY
MKHCLIVDDSEVIRKVAKRVLEEINFTSTEAETFDEAYERCRKAAPDAILLDWHMPAGNPHELIERLRADSTGDQPVIFYCTSEYDPEDISRAFKAGADRYLMKPFDRESIVHGFASAGLLT